MDKIMSLRKQHLDMFDKKRAEHKKMLSDLYLEYTDKIGFSTACKSEIFSNFYNLIAESFPAEIYDNERIVGTCWHWQWGGLCQSRETPRNGGHYIADFECFLKQGICGRLAAIEKTESDNKIYMATALKAFSRYIERYSEAAKRLASTSADEYNRKRLLKISEDCHNISYYPPETFSQALQLVWFIQCFLETEANNAAISFGRMDNYLYHYYMHDIKNNTMSEQQALELIICFYIKASEGDESQFLTVGGNTENELSALFVKAQRIINMRQPSVGVLVSEATSSNLMEEAKELAQNGGGMPAFFNEDIIKRGLKNMGIEEKDADNFGIVGCYEAAPQGSFSNTVAYGYNLYDSFRDFVSLNKEYKSFNKFLTAYKEYYTEYYKNILIPKFKKSLDYIRSAVSPFAACALDGCTESGLLPEQGGCRYFLFGLNILGIGILIDSIYTVKNLVFEQKQMTLEQLTEAAKNDFADSSVLEKIKAIETAYGSNSEESNLLARELSEFIYKVTADNPLCEGVIVSPALFWFTADIWQRDYEATLNGRKKGELFSYGVMPCASPHNNEISAVLLSSARIACDQFPNGCPTMITLNKSDIEKTEILNAVIKSYFKSGGSHLAINTVNADVLEKAKQNPGDYPNVLVKISGYSAKFTGLSENIQDAVIERAKNKAKLMYKTKA